MSGTWRSCMAVIWEDWSWAGSWLVSWIFVSCVNNPRLRNIRRESRPELLIDARTCDKWYWRGLKKFLFPFSLKLNIKYLWKFTQKCEPYKVPLKLFIKESSNLSKKHQNLYSYWCNNISFKEVSSNFYLLIGWFMIISLQVT